MQQPPRTKKLTLSIPTDAYDNLARVAERAHLTEHQFGALVLSRFSDLRPERALSALTAIPDDFFKRGPGRPPSGTVRTDPEVPETAGQHAS